MSVRRVHPYKFCFYCGGKMNLRNIKGLVIIEAEYHCGKCGFTAHFNIDFTDETVKKYYALEYGDG